MAWSKLTNDPAITSAPAASTRNVIVPTSSSVVPLVVKAAVGQTANIQEWQSSGGSAETRITAARNFETVDAEIRCIAGGVGTAMGLTTSGVKYHRASLQRLPVGAAGAAAALPATPAKYFQIVDSAGTIMLIPAYTLG